jgi:EpsI family protein
MSPTTMSSSSSNGSDLPEPTASHAPAQSNDDPRNPPASQQRRALLALLLMGGASGAAWQLTPRTRMSTLHGEFQLEQVVPKQFGDWQMDERAVGGIINPQQEAMLKQIYSQTLSRTYVDRQGRRVMLSIAYGQDQRDAMQLHYPEVCYPAQGFQVLKKSTGALELPQGTIPIRRLETVFGNQRYEPLTYWTVVGERTTLGGVDKKLIELSYGLDGVIVDGLLFRVSSIDRDTSAAYALQADFVKALIGVLSPQQRRRLAGLRQ